MPVKLMPMGELAEHLGLKRKTLHAQLRRARIATQLIPTVTKRGIRDTVGVPMDHARALIRRTEQARKNAARAAS